MHRTAAAQYVAARQRKLSVILRVREHFLSVHFQGSRADAVMSLILEGLCRHLPLPHNLARWLECVVLVPKLLP